VVLTLFKDAIPRTSDPGGPTTRTEVIMLFSQAMTSLRPPGPVITAGRSSYGRAQLITVRGRTRRGARPEK
jgi:hypothetical protein